MLSISAKRGREHEVEGDEEQEPHVDAALGDPVEDLVAADGRRPAANSADDIAVVPIGGRWIGGSGFPTTAILEGASSSVLEGGFFFLRPLAAAAIRPSTPSWVTSVPRQRADDGAIAQDDDPVGALDDLLELGRDQHDRQPRLGQLADQALDLGLGADVDAAGRIVEQQHPWLEAQDAGEQDLLLVAAGQLADPLIGARRLDPQAAS